MLPLPLTCPVFGLTGTWKLCRDTVVLLSWAAPAGVRNQLLSASWGRGKGLLCTHSRGSPGLSPKPSPAPAGGGFLPPCWFGTVTVWPALGEDPSWHLSAVEAGASRARDGGVRVPAPGSLSLLCCLC